MLSACKIFFPVHSFTDYAIKLLLNPFFVGIKFKLDRLLLGFNCVNVLDDWVLPSVVQKGDKVDLRCNFHLSGEAMYSLKWYRDNVEFYRYIPSGGLSKGWKILFKLKMNF